MDNNRINLDEELVIENFVPFEPYANNLPKTVNSAPLFFPSPQPTPSSLIPVIQQPQVLQNMNYNNPMANMIVYSSNLILNTDEPLEIVAEKVNTESYENLISFSIKPLFDKLKIKSPVELPCTVTLKGGAADLELIEKNRQGLDLIFIVDISGSMGSGKIDLVKITIEFVITLLKDFDRVSVIGFSDSAFIYCPLTVMNEQGRASMTRIINTLGPTGNTNIECGVRAALHMLADRKFCNQITSLLLLSDGCDNDTRSVNRRIQLAIEEFKYKIKGSYRMHTFGYGRDHDSVVMNLMAELTNGNFYYVEKEATVTDAFANCMGELVALLASNIKVSLTTKVCDVPFKLSKVYSNTGDTVFTMPDVFFGDKKDSVFVLDFEAVQGDFAGQKIVPVEAVATFTLKNGEQTRKTAVLELVIAGNNEEFKKNENVLLEYYRVKGAESLKQVMKLADAGKFAEAREVAKVSEEEISRSEVANNPKIQALIRDIRDSQGRTESKNTWNSGGRAQVTSIQDSHFNKVAKPNCMAYQNHAQTVYSMNYNTFMSSKSAPSNYAQTVPINPNYAEMPQKAFLNYFPQINPGPTQQVFPGNAPQAFPRFLPPQMPGLPQAFLNSPPQINPGLTQQIFPGNAPQIFPSSPHLQMYGPPQGLLNSAPQINPGPTQQFFPGNAPQAFPRFPPPPQISSPPQLEHPYIPLHISRPPQASNNALVPLVPGPPPQAQIVNQVREPQMPVDLHQQALPKSNS